MPDAPMPLLADGRCPMPLCREWWGRVVSGQQEVQRSAGWAGSGIDAQAHHQGPPSWQDLAAGTIAGTAQLLVGHPFDTIKVRR